MYDWFVALPTSGPGSLAFQSYFNAGNSRERLADHPDTEASYLRLFGEPTA